MALTIPVPNDATYDYVPIDGSQIELGTDLLALWTVQGEVNGAFPPDAGDGDPNGVWVYFMGTLNPDGAGDTGVAVFPETPSAMPADWWGRMAIWKRAAKLDDGEGFTAADGSEWIYAADGDGRCVCWQAGSTFARDDRRFRGELTTDPKDLWVCDDADWDWLPIADGSEVNVGDTVTFLLTATQTVDSIVLTENESYRRHSFVDEDEGAQLGWWDEILQPSPIVWLNTWTYFERLPKPGAQAKFRAPDGSRWIYAGSSLYYCWGRGPEYSPGALFHRGEVTGGLTPIT